MYKIYFYEEDNGISPIYEYIQELASKKDKNSRINHAKINDYIQLLSEFGNVLNETFMKHIERDIWELRPIRNRIFFASWSDDSFILLHHFKKTTQKTPRREIEKAKQNLKNAIERGY